MLFPCIYPDLIPLLSQYNIVGFLFLLSVPAVPGHSTLKNEEVDKIEFWAAKQGLLRVKQS